MKEPFTLLDYVARVGDERVPAHAELVGRSGRTIYLPAHWLPGGAEVGALLTVTKEPGTRASAFRCELLIPTSEIEPWDRGQARITAWADADNPSLEPPMQLPFVLDTFLSEATSEAGEAVARLKRRGEAVYINAELLPQLMHEGDTVRISAEVAVKTARVTLEHAGEEAR